MFLHVLRHIDADHRVLVAEHRFGQRASQLGFPDARRAKEDERTHRPFRVLKACAGPADRPAHGFHRFILADHPLMQNTLHIEQAFRFLFLQLVHGDSRPAGDDLGDIFRRHFGIGAALFFFPLVFRQLKLFADLLFGIAKRRRFFEFLALHGRVLLLADVLEPAFQLLQIRRYRIGVEPYSGPGFIDKIDRFVRQEAVLDIAVGQLNGLINRFIGDFHAVMRFIAVAQPVQNLDRFFHRRLVDRNRLEAPFQRGVFFDVLAVLIERRRPDALQFAAGQRRLQDVRSVDRAFRAAGPDQRMQLVDEQDNVAGLADFVHDFFQAVFKFAAIFGSRYDGAHIERHDAFVAQRFGNFVVDDFLRQAFGDRRFTDPRLPDQDRVVFRPAAEHLNNPFDFLAAADDRIKVTFLGGGRQIAGQAVQGWRIDIGRRAVMAGDGFAAAEQLQHLLARLIQADAKVVQYARGDTFAFTNQPEQNMLRADVSMAQLARFVHRQFDYFFGARRIGDIGGLLLSPADQGFNFVLDFLQAKSEPDQSLGGNAFAFANEAKQHVLRADIVMSKPYGFFLG